MAPATASASRPEWTQGTSAGSSLAVRSYRSRPCSDFSSSWVRLSSSSLRRRSPSASVKSALSRLWPLSLGRQADANGTTAETVNRNSLRERQVAAPSDADKRGGIVAGMAMEQDRGGPAGKAFGRDGTEAEESSARGWEAIAEWTSGVSPPRASTYFAECENSSSSTPSSRAAAQTIVRWILDRRRRDRPIAVAGRPGSPARRARTSPAARCARRPARRARPRSRSPRRRAPASSRLPRRRASRGDGRSRGPR